MTFAMCWKCHNCIRKPKKDDDGEIISYTITGCKENEEIKDFNDAQVLCPLFKEQSK